MSKPTVHFGYTLIELLAVVFIVGLVGAATCTVVVDARVSARRMQCLANLRQIGQASIAVSDQCKRFPGAGTAGYQDWSIALLPKLERLRQYQKFDRRYPAGSEINLSNCEMPTEYACSEREIRSTIIDIDETHFAMNGELSNVKVHNVSNTSKTIMYSESQKDSLSPWILSPA
ncbi:MAG: DUF1559 domain-containing protein [Pirellulales bacterium]